MKQKTKTDLLCFSHLRWDFVYQRPQHLMSRFTKKYRVFFIEEPKYHAGKDSFISNLSTENVWVVTPYLQDRQLPGYTEIDRQKILLKKLIDMYQVERFIGWFYTPMALKIATQLAPELCIYDCMDELSAFKFAPPELKLLEAELFKKAKLVFTGGHCLYDAKKHLHENIHPFPSSIDKKHFMQGRVRNAEPADQEGIAPLRFGFYGVIDERFDIQLIKEIAEKRPEWQLILIGPVVKINESDLPRQSNIHYLGNKSYNELPHYLSGWDIAMIPFAKNDSTRFISPTKTPEYLAAGKPVISTSITDVVNPYGDKKLVHIADDADNFIRAAEKELAKSKAEYKNWLQQVDNFLADLSWDITVEKMMDLLDSSLLNKNFPPERNALRVA